VQGISFPARGGFERLADVLGVLPDAWQHVWRPAEIELVSCPETESDVSEAHRLSDLGDTVPIHLLRRLAVANVQMIEGEWQALASDGHTILIVIRSVRGDEWDVQAADTAVLDHVRHRVPNAIDLPT